MKLPLVSAILASAVSLAGAAPAAQPNVIFILTDDLGWGDVGVFFQKSRQLASVRSKPWQLTPNLDQCAARGVLLHDHYCPAPVCAPSRASLLLGVSQGHANVRDNQFDKSLENNHTIATVLRRAGYTTVAVGKWGLQGEGPGEDSPATWPAFPTRRGFDAFFGYARHADGHEHYPKEAPYTTGNKSKQVWDGTNDVTPQLDKCYTCDLWTAWAKHWIADHQRTNSARPFFMYLAYDTPHATQELPTQAYPPGGGLHGGLQWLGAPGQMINTASATIDSWIHPDYRLATFDDDNNPATPEVPWPDVYKRYATAIRRLDDAVGDLNALLRDLKIDRDTLVVFSSDNGPSIESYIPREPLRADFFGSYGPFDGIKRDCWEGGLRVPTLAWWPGHFPAGRVVSRSSISYDWLPTFAEAAGLPAPARADGVSLL
ncbi:MAG TPA: sulfatase-like hydrolase/transferase, partial [Candidatus Acidoferrum sp.]|nr:sulfatase-like hydrolase/transferase [Candidatus Acidoferrum sp.]